MVRWKREQAGDAGKEHNWQPRLFQIARYRAHHGSSRLAYSNILQCAGQTKRLKFKRANLLQCWTNQTVGTKFAL